jgi:hypothetical protein
LVTIILHKRGTPGLAAKYVYISAASHLIRFLFDESAYTLAAIHGSLPILKGLGIFKWAYPSIRSA